MISKIKFNTAEETKKPETDTIPSANDDKSNGEVEKLNKQIVELAEKNSELLVKHMIFH